MERNVLLNHLLKTSVPGTHNPKWDYHLDFFNSSNWEYKDEEQKPKIVQINNSLWGVPRQENLYDIERYSGCHCADNFFYITDLHTFIEAVAKGGIAHGTGGVGNKYELVTLPSKPQMWKTVKIFYETGNAYMFGDELKKYLESFFTNGGNNVTYNSLMVAYKLFEQERWCVK